jgi:hypothetical protein
MLDSGRVCLMAEGMHDGRGVCLAAREDDWEHERRIYFAKMIICLIK